MRFIILNKRQHCSGVF